ncbi:50S ribosomal protein L1 [Leuconostocaceae bacterium ESL0958]|nr:50S ribosomal protein L1 [Leuconostocaceae bacterium ESL0958]
MTVKHGKKYLEAAAKVDAEKAYALQEGIALLKEVSYAKFDGSVELVFNLNVDTRQADQQLRGATVLPNGSGKTKTVAVFAQGDKAKEAEAAGADVVGAADLVQKIQGGWMDFDVAIATPDMMAQVGRVGRALGPKGLMPNPKTGTVTMDVTKAVSDAKGGQVTYRTDRDGNVSVTVGRTSFEDDKLAENVKAIAQTILKARPSAVKGTYVQNVAISSTMSPAVKLDIASL